MATPKSDQWKDRRRKDPAAAVKTRKKKPTSPHVKETAQERLRRNLVEQLRRPMGRSATAAYDKAAYLRHEDLAGLKLALFLDPPKKKGECKKCGGETEEIDTRALSARLRTLNSAGASVDKMRAERSDAPDTITVHIVFGEPGEPPDVPVYHDDETGALDRSREAHERRGGDDGAA